MFQQNKKTKIIVNKDPNHEKVNWQYLLIFFAGSAIIGYSVIAMNHCWVERFLVECASDRNQSQYEAINKQAEDALNNFLQTNNLRVMQMSREEINSAIGKLAGIKNTKNVSECCPQFEISSSVEKDLPKLKVNLIDTDIVIKAEKLALDAGKLSLKAKTITDLENAKNGFEDAIVNISKISDASTLMQKVIVNREGYKNKLIALNERIKQEKESKKEREKIKVRAEQEILKQLDDDKLSGEHAIQKARLAMNINELKDAEKMLVEVINRLNQATKSSVNENEIYSKLKDYELTLLKVRNAIAKPSCSTALFGDCVNLPLTLP
jgi:hypothetical protein